MSKNKCIFGLHCVADEVTSDVVHYCERFLELVIDLEALLPTRRFFNTVLDDCHLVVRCHLSNLPRLAEGNLFAQVGNAILLFTV
jgi:intron-binding protein aquarius